MSGIGNLKDKLNQMRLYNDCMIKERNKNIFTAADGKTIQYLHTCYITEFYENHKESVVSRQIDFNDYLKRLLDDLINYFTDLE